METFLPILIWGGLLFLMMRFGCRAHMFGHGHGVRHKTGKTGTIYRSMFCDG